MNTKNINEYIKYANKLDPSSIEKIPCINLLDYHQKRQKLIRNRNIKGYNLYKL